MKGAMASIAISAALVMVGSAAWPFPDSSHTYPGKPESVIIGEKPFESSALVYITEDQGYFAGNGLNVTMQNYDSAPLAINGLGKQETDIALSSEFAVTENILNEENISVIGCVDRFLQIYLIGRKDRGIECISDLKGKKIGTSIGGSGVFYLGRFLDLHGMSMQDITLVDLPTSQYVNSLANGSVDALITGIYFDQIQEQLSSNAVIWAVQSNQPGYWVISCQSDWAASHPEQINRLLKSLNQAEEYTIKHPEEAKAVVQKKLNFTDAYLESIWPKHQFSLALDQSLIAAMEDEARWMISNNLTAKKTVPDFTDYIYTKGLEEVKPDAVNIW